MKVSDLIMHIMKIMRRDLKKIGSSRFRDSYKKALKVNILNEGALIQLVRKRVSFQDRKNENAPKFPSIKRLY